MNNTITNLLMALLGRRAAYRLGRALYQKAHGDSENKIAANGELLLQNCVLTAWGKSLIPERKLVVFDVGANIGDWSYELLNTLSKSNGLQSLDLYLFEPTPSTAEALKKRLARFSGALHFEQSVLSSESGEAQFFINRIDNNAGTNSLYHQEDIDAASISVIKSKADTFCEVNKIEKIHLFKCDTEGHDMEVIRGALPLLAQGKITVFQFEYSYRWVYSRNFLRDVFAIVENLPYKVAKIQGDHLLILTEWHYELEKFFEGNYALIHTNALEWFPLKTGSFDRFNALCVDPK